MPASLSVCGLPVQSLIGRSCGSTGVKVDVERPFVQKRSSKRLSTLRSAAVCTRRLTLTRGDGNGDAGGGEGADARIAFAFEGCVMTGVAGSRSKSSVSGKRANRDRNNEVGSLRVDVEK